MVKREIKDFELVTDTGRYLCATPCSVSSALALAEASGDEIIDTVSFEGAFNIDDAAFSMKHIYIRVRGVRMPFELFVNGDELGSFDGKQSVYNVCVNGKVRLGENRLEIRFTDCDNFEARYASIPCPIEILRFSGAIIDRAAVSQTHGAGGVKLDVRLDILGNPDNVRAVATLVSPTGQIYYGGLTRGKGSITVNDPLFWWPRGLGVQNLYRLTVNLYVDMEVEDSLEMRIGLRTVKTKSTADSSALTVNGVDFMPMGATFYPDRDPDFASLDRKIEAYVTSAAMSEFNTILIPADAARPSDKLYELCDAHGILIIEEIVGFDRTDALALERKAHHASLGIVDIIYDGAAVEQITDMLESAVPDLDFALSESAPEYISYPSLPAIKTTMDVLEPDERNLFSYSMEKMAKKEDIQKMLLMVADRYPYPTDLADFTYAASLAASYKVGEAVRSARLSRGKEGRAIFNRLGDPTPVVSASSIDSRARWKALQYHASRHFAPVALYVQNEGYNVSFSASNVRKHVCLGIVEYRIADSSNKTVFSASEPCEIAAGEARRLFVRDFSEYVKGNERDYYLEYSLKEGASTLSHGTLLFVPEKHFRFKKPNIRAEIVGSDRKFSVTLTSDVFVKDLELDFLDADAVFAENYIDITADAPVKISFSVTGGLETAYHLTNSLRMRSVYDLNS